MCVCVMVSTKVLSNTPDFNIYNNEKKLLKTKSAY